MVHTVILFPFRCSEPSTAMVQLSGWAYGCGIQRLTVVDAVKDPLLLPAPVPLLHTMFQKTSTRWAGLAHTWA